MFLSLKNEVGQDELLIKDIKCLTKSYVKAFFFFFVFLLTTLTLNREWYYLFLFIASNVSSLLVCAVTYNKTAKRMSAFDSCNYRWTQKWKGGNLIKVEGEINFEQACLWFEKNTWLLNYEFLDIKEYIVAYESSGVGVTEAIEMANSHIFWKARDKYRVSLSIIRCLNYKGK